jgi:NitT/TauT family transport system substrate-binding protein
MNVLGTGIVASDKMLADDPELAKAFVRATTKSWQEVEANQEEAVKIMSEAATEPPPDNVLANQLKDTLPLLQGDGGGIGVNSEESWQETIDLLSDGGMLKEAKKPADYWDASYAAKG